MRYICTRDWRDLTDKHLYHVGDPFPFDGREVPAERLRDLESGSNRAGLQMIQGINDQAAPEAQPEEAKKAQPETAAEEKPKARKPRKPKAQE